MPNRPKTNKQRPGLVLPTVDDNPSKTREPIFEQPGFLYFLLFGVLALSGAYYLALYRAFPKAEERAQFGDTFGAINAIFTGLAFAAVAYGISLQRREIKLQQRELAETRDVFKQQSFETSYFNLQRVLAETIDRIQWDVRSNVHLVEWTTLAGRRALKVIVESIYQEYISRLQHHESTYALHNQPRELPPATQLEWIVQAYTNFYKSNESLLGNYFRLFYNILKYVSHSDFPSLEKERYAHFFRAQLSEAELTLIVLNAMTPTGEKMRRYLEEFAMLKHATMEGRGIPKPRDHFHENAFKDSDERKPQQPEA